MKLIDQFRKVYIHVLNLISNLFPSDSLSMRLRCHLFRLIGAKIGNGTTIAGGGYIYGGNIDIGSKVFINRDCYFDLSAKVTLGDNVVIGHHVIFITADHKIGDGTRRCGPVAAKQILVKSGAWIGANCVILPGVTIGSGVVVGANSLVTKDIPDNVLVMGSPAILVRNLH